MEERKLEIKCRTFTVECPTSKQLDGIKKELGFDISKGMDEEKQKKLYEDTKTVCKVCAMLVTEKLEPEDGSAEWDWTGRIEELTEFFYENAKLSEIKRVLRFFTLSLQED